MSLYASIKDRSKTGLGISGHPKGQISHMHGIVPAVVEKLYLQAEKDENTKVRCCYSSSLRHVCLVATPWTPARQASLSFRISWGWLTFTSIESEFNFPQFIWIYISVIFWRTTRAQLLLRALEIVFKDVGKYTRVHCIMWGYGCVSACVYVKHKPYVSSSHPD